MHWHLFQQFYNQTHSLTGNPAVHGACCDESLRCVFIKRIFSLNSIGDSWVAALWSVLLWHLFRKEVKDSSSRHPRPHAPRPASPPARRPSLEVKKERSGVLRCMFEWVYCEIFYGNSKQMLIFTSGKFHRTQMLQLLLFLFTFILLHPGQGLHAHCIASHSYLTPLTSWIDSAQLKGVFFI